MYRQKKKRGWKRRVRELDRWAAEHASIDLRDLVDSGYVSAEVWFERWPTPFPMAVRRRMIEHLVSIHDRWRAELDAWGEPCYLGLWLFEPGVKESQVCAAVGQRAADYAARHTSTNRVAPPPQYHRHPCDLARFEWTRHVHLDRALLTDYPEADWPWLRHQAHAVRRTEHGVILEFQNESWLGRVADRG